MGKKSAAEKGAILLGTAALCDNDLVMLNTTELNHQQGPQNMIVFVNLGLCKHKKTDFTQQDKPFEITAK